MNLATPESVRKLQRALYAKAKANPTFRFYTLYDKIYRKDVLQEAWSRCRANDGSSGVDGQSFEGIERKGVERWVEQLAQDVVGPVCESSDVFAKERPLVPPKPGDFLALLGAGAYGMSMSSNYNSRPRAAEVLVDGDRYRVIREREQREDLWRGETT